jgi:ribosomal subunit interface protein
MQIIIKSRQTVIPRSMREFAAAKVERLSRLLDRIQSVEIAVGESAARKVEDKNFVEVTLTTKLRRLHAEAHGPDLMTAIERAVDKAEAQLRRVKGKAIARTRRSGGHVEADKDARAAALNGAADAPQRISARAAGNRS